MGILFTCNGCGKETTGEFEPCPCGHNGARISYFGEEQEYTVEVTVEKKYQVTVKARHESEAKDKAEDRIDEFNEISSEIQYSDIVDD